jgi:tRNA(fMet)-specific endonuclease VapC
MTLYLLDTNHASAILTKNSLMLAKISEAIGSGSLGIAMPSVAELWFMVFNSQRVEQNTQETNELLEGLTRFDLDEDAAKEFGRVKAELRKAGRPIPDPDSQIAAIARVNNLVVLTADAHFGYVSNLKTENWLA